MKTIESTTNHEIKELVKLHKKKGRDARNAYLVEGEHLVEEAEKAGVLVHLYSLEPVPYPVETTICSQAVLNKLSQQRSDAKIIGLCRKKKQVLAKCDRILLLNEVQDPGNVGTLLRSAYSFGFDTIYLSKGCADVYNEKTIQASQGALFQLAIEEGETLETIEALKEKGYEVYGTALSQYSRFLDTLTFPKKIAFVLGNEGQGLPEEILAHCSSIVKINMANFESLNVAIAGSICMYSAFIDRLSQTD